MNEEEFKADVEANEAANAAPVVEDAPVAEEAQVEEAPQAEAEAPAAE